MTLEGRLHAYIKHMSSGGNPDAFAHLLEDVDYDIWVSRWTNEDGTTRLEIRVEDEQYGQFMNGRRVEPSWEGGINGPDVDEWEDIRKL